MTSVDFPPKTSVYPNVWTDSLTSVVVPSLSFTGYWPLIVWNGFKNLVMIEHYRRKHCSWFSMYFWPLSLPQGHLCTPPSLDEEPLVKHSPGWAFLIRLLFCSMKDCLEFLIIRKIKKYIVMVHVSKSWEEMRLMLWN